MFKADQETAPIRIFGAINFAIIVILLSFMVREIWLRDLTYGDTSSYFLSAVAWSERGTTNILWSPLYTIFYGTVWETVLDANTATWLHRVILVLISDVLVTFIAFRALPHPLNIALCLWWALLPIHFDTLYEVHLFGALPLLLMISVPFIVSDRWVVAIWLGISSVTTLLVRNEYVVLTAVIVVFALARTYASLVRKPKRLRLVDTVPYVAVLAVCVALTSLVWVRSDRTLDEMSGPAKAKHTLNMCQVYAFGHQQRHPEWTSSPWVECEPLMQETFGLRNPTLREMIFANPAAVASHFAWNFALAPLGFELLLFNAVGGGPNPDYVPPPIIPIIPHILLGGMLLAALVWSYRIIQAKPGTRRASAAKIWDLMPLLVGGTLMVGLIIATQRPRPSYLLGYGVLIVLIWLLLADAAMPQLQKINAWWQTALLVCFACLIVPSYRLGADPLARGYLGTLYNQAKVSAAALCASPGKLGLGSYAFELKSYVCSPQLTKGSNAPPTKDREVVNMYGFDKSWISNSFEFVDSIQRDGVATAVVDIYLIDTYPQLGDCESIRSAFLARGWVELSYLAMPNERCIAIFNDPKLAPN